MNVRRHLLLITGLLLTVAHADAATLLPGLYISDPKPFSVPLASQMTAGALFPQFDPASFGTLQSVQVKVNLAVSGASATITNTSPTQTNFLTNEYFSYNVQAGNIFGVGSNLSFIFSNQYGRPIEPGQSIRRGQQSATASATDGDFYTSPGILDQSVLGTGLVFFGLSARFAPERSVGFNALVATIDSGTLSGTVQVTYKYKGPAFLDPTAVPEPSTLALAGVGGLISLGAWWRSRQRSSA